jgi:hypothetical protein
MTGARESTGASGVEYGLQGGDALVSSSPRAGACAATGVWVAETVHGVCGVCSTARTTRAGRSSTCGSSTCGRCGGWRTDSGPWSDVQVPHAPELCSDVLDL